MKLNQIHLSTRYLIALSILAMSAPVLALPAFPGAEGPGADATGGRGGDVYHVTNLLDYHPSGTDTPIPGSLRYGLETAPAGGRTIVFDVGGEIQLVADVHNSTHTWLRSGAPNITIAGQTAPGASGITVTGQGAKLSGNNWIMRHMKFRPGQDQSRPGVLTNDGVSNNLQNSIIDHVSVSWADDEGISSTDAVVNTTVQYSIIGEGLNYNDHSFGSLISSENDDAHLSYHHNLFIHNRSRNPRLGSEAGTGAITSFTNNVVYNWYGRAGYSIDDKPSRTNYLGNYYIMGVNTRGTDTVFYSPDTDTIIYHDDTNYIDVNKNGTVDGQVFGFSGLWFSGTYQEASTPFDVPSGHIQAAPDAVDQVLDHVGALWWDRDPVDERLTNDVRNGTGLTINNISDAPQDPNYTYDAEGYPIYGVTQRAADFDVDNDGMPGVWELKHGLNPNVADNNGDFDSDGYTNLEDYINELGAFPAPTAIQWLGGSGRYALSQNWGISQTVPVGTFTNWQPSRYDTAEVVSGEVSVDAPGQHAGDLRVATGSADSATLNITDGWLDVDGELVIAPASIPGAVNLIGGALRAGSVSQGRLGAFSFTGGVLTVGQFNLGLTNDGGTLAPGQGVGGEGLGVTGVAGDLVLNSGTLAIDLASASEADQLLVGGALTLGGDLEVNHLDGYDPAGGSWVIASATNISGAFTSVTAGFVVTLQGGDLLLSTAFVPGDANGDGAVDILDLDILSSNFGATGGATLATGDFNGDGNVDILDLDILSSNFGSGAGSAAVPEPTGALLILLGVSSVCLAQRQSRR